MLLETITDHSSSISSTSISELRMMDFAIDETTKTVLEALPATVSFVNLQLLNGGSFTGSTGKLHAGVKDEKFRMYNWAFYVNNPVLNRHVLWDLGMTSVRYCVYFEASFRLKLG